MDNDELVLNCSCSQLHHMVRFSFEPDDSNNEFEAYVGVSLERGMPLWQRIKIAVRYLFNRLCGFGEAAAIIIRDKDLPKLRAWLERAEHEANIRKMRYEGLSRKPRTPSEVKELLKGIDDPIACAHISDSALKGE